MKIHGSVFPLIATLAALSCEFHLIALGVLFLCLFARLLQLDLKQSEDAKAYRE